MGDILKLEPSPKGQLDTWILKFRGREGTDLYPGFYDVEMVIPESYPANFPMCKFKNGFKHYHIYQSGAICLPMLKTGGWSSAKTILVLSNNIVNMVHSDLVVHDHADNELRRIYHLPDGPQKYRELIRSQA